MKGPPGGRVIMAWYLFIAVGVLLTFFALAIFVW